MSDEPPHHHARAHAWALRAMAALLVLLGVYPLADHLGFADPQVWWRRAWHAWALWTPVVLLAALLLARLQPGRWPARAERWRRALLALPPMPFAVLVGGVTCMLALAVGSMMFLWQPVTIDELSQLWQAHLLASGHLYAAAEPHPEFFSTMQTVTYEGRWFSHFPVGGPLLQSLGLRAGLPYLVNPLLAGFGAIAVYGFASTTGEETEARLAALLFALSPFVMVVAGSRLDHVATLAAVWIALAALPAWLAAETDAAASKPAAVIGLALGGAIMVRPYDGAVATLVVGAFQLLSAGRRAPRWRSLLVQAAAGAVPVGVLLAVNRALTGHPLTFAYDVLNGPDHRPGFHMSPLGYEHTPLTGLYRVSSYVMRLNGALLGWPVPVVALTALSMAAWRRASRWDTLLVAYLAATLVAYLLYWGDGSFHGPRFLFQVLPVFLLFIARLPAALRERLRGPVLRAAVLLLIPLWLGVAWLLPPSRWQPFGPWNITAGYKEQERISGVLVETVRRHQLRNALVFVQDGWHQRLTARMRALGIPPFKAQLIVGNFNGCTLQARLDESERRHLPSARAAAWITGIMNEPLDSRPVPGLSALEQLALPRVDSAPPACRWEFEHALGRGMDLARLLPLIPVDSLGRIGGDVVYARDFGARNELLRDRFPDRAWYVARPEVRNDTLRFTLEPWQSPTARASRP